MAADLDVWQRCLAAGAASFVAQALVNPLDVVKVSTCNTSNTFTQLYMYAYSFFTQIINVFSIRIYSHVDA